MDLEVSGARARFLIRDRDGKFPGLFDTVLHDAWLKIVLSGVQMPRINPVMERWVQTCRHELLAARSSGISATPCTRSGSSSTPATSIGPTGLWRMPHRYARYLNRLPILSGSYTLRSADGTGSAAPSTSTGMLPDQHG